MTPYFLAATRRHIDVHRAHLGERLLAVYVWGSVHRDEAVPGVSDLDMHAFIAGSGDEADLQWLSQGREAMETEFPGLAALSRPLPASLLEGHEGPSSPAWARARAFGFRLRYDATLVWGRDLVTNEIVPSPDREFARRAFASVRDSQNKTDFDLPRKPAPRLRKLARLAVLGAGYLRMARGQFRSFKGTDVLPPLLTELPEWEPFLRTTQRLYLLPPDTSAAEADDYLPPLLGWLDWVNGEIGSA